MTKYEEFLRDFDNVFERVVEVHCHTSYRNEGDEEMRERIARMIEWVDLVRLLAPMCAEDEEDFECFDPRRPFAVTVRFLHQIGWRHDEPNDQQVKLAKRYGLIGHVGRNHCEWEDKGRLAALETLRSQIARLIPLSGDMTGQKKILQGVLGSIDHEVQLVRDCDDTDALDKLRAAFVCEYLQTHKNDGKSFTTLRYKPSISFA